MPLNFEQIDRGIDSAESILDVLRVVMSVNIASGLKGTSDDLENAFMSELASSGGVTPTSAEEARHTAEIEFNKMCANPRNEARSAEENIESYSAIMGTSKSELIGDNLLELKKYFGNNTLDESKITAEMLQDFLINEICEKKLSTITELTAKGIIEIWRQTEILNQGDPDFLVTSLKEELSQAPSREVDIETCTQEQFNDKINYALENRGGEPFAMLVGGGIHWYTVIIDPKAKKFLVADSSVQDKESDDFLDDDDPLGENQAPVDPRILELISNTPQLLGFSDVTKIPEEKQQHDSRSCGFWAALNMSGCIGKDLEEYTPPTSSDGNKIFDKIQLDFLKRTTKEFIRSEEVRRAMIESMSLDTPASTPSPRSIIMESPPPLKTLSAESTPPQDREKKSTGITH